MANGFRRIALARGLLCREKPADTPRGWTDDELASLLQVDETRQPMPDIAAVPPSQSAAAPAA